MTTEDLEQWHKDWVDKKVSGGDYILFLNTYINKREQVLEKEKDLHSLTRHRFEEASEHIKILEKDRDYWKLSFNDQVKSNKMTTFETVKGV